MCQSYGVPGLDIGQIRIHNVSTSDSRGNARKGAVCRGGDEKAHTSISDVFTHSGEQNSPVHLFR